LVDRVTKVFPQEQCTVAVTYSGCISLFILLSYLFLEASHEAKLYYLMEGVASSMSHLPIRAKQPKLELQHAPEPKIADDDTATSRLGLD
jgi:hypothetical protein